MSETHAPAPTCARCGRPFTGDNPAVRYRGANWCRRDYEADLGIAGGVDEVYDGSSASAGSSSTVAETATPRHRPSLALPGGGTAALLHGIAWVALAAGVLGGLWTFQVLGTVEVPTPSSLFGAGEPSRVLNPVGVALAAGFAGQGIVFFALCRGIARAVENTVALGRWIERR